MQKIGVFGGTFNPIHNGHLHLCYNCAERLELDRILLIPTHRPPHKTANDLASDQDRLRMCALAVDGDPLFEVSDLEIQRAGVSYTVDTLHTLRERFPEDELYFILGSDMLFIFDRWHRYEEILTLCTVVAGAREGEELERMRDYHQTVLGGTPKVKLLPFDALPMSSTSLRRAIRVEKGQAEGLPPAVAAYIAKHGLYHKEDAPCGT